MDSSQVEIVTAAEIPAGDLEALTASIARLAAELLPGRRVGLKLMSDEEIRELNARFRGRDAATDVLSFPSGQPAGSGSFAGDIALSWDAIQRQAVANGNTALAEAAALFAHGALHLAGHTHETAADQRHMDDLTRRACRAAGVEVERFGH